MFCLAIVYAADLHYFCLQMFIVGKYYNGKNGKIITEK